MSVNNYQSPSNFEFSINALKDANLYIQRVALPSSNIGKIEVYNAAEGDVPVPSNRVNFETVNVTIIIDEGLTNYKEIFEWMHRCTLTEDAHLNETSDATLIINSNSNVPIQRIEYQDMFPITMSELEFDTTLEGEEVLICSVVFAFDKFVFA